MLLRVPAPCRSHCSWNIALWDATLATLRSLIARLRHAMVIAFFLLLSLMGSNPAFASWSTNFGGQMAGTASVKSTATDASANVYVVGTFSGGSMTEPALTKIGNEDTFGRLLARSNSNQPTIR